MNKRQTKKKITSKSEFKRFLKKIERGVQSKLDKEGIAHRSDKSKRHIRKRIDAMSSRRTKVMERETSK